MGTKAQPGACDCYAKAEPDEELFTLLARDRLAPGLVFIWSALKSHQFAIAEVMFNDLLKLALELPTERTHKVYEAMLCGDRMISWRRQHYGEPTAAGSTAPSAAPATQSSESTDTPNAADAAE